MKPTQMILYFFIIFTLCSTVSVACDENDEQCEDKPFSHEDFLKLGGMPFN